jgi:indolepyruvate ferredoxin oxidoreductase beta subunit
MQYQIVIAGFGGQGVVFLVKVLAICAGNKNIKFLGTENHGMSQRGGAVSCDIKIGDFTNPVIEKAQANLIIGLDRNESLRNVAFLRKNGILVTNTQNNFPLLPFDVYTIDANKKALNNEFDIKGLNVFMLGYTLQNVKDFPFSIDEVKQALKQINPKVYEQNLQILKLGLIS